MKDTSDVRALEAYGRQFAGTVYAELARQRLEMLKSPPVASAAPFANEPNALPTNKFGSSNGRASPTQRVRETFKGVTLSGEVIDSIRALDFETCTLQCERDHRCVAIEIDMVVSRCTFYSLVARNGVSDRFNAVVFDNYPLHRVK